ncbi:MAG: DUF1800 domain-containing protein [Planctomycetota bacterium]|nr:MAG: DUF1800 domain-containing protein [Planctomycetota bacterium]
MPLAPEDRLPANLRPLKPERFGYEQARHLLWRAGFGGTPEQINTLASWGIERAVDYIVDFDKIEYPSPAADRFDPDIIRPLTPDEQRQLRIARQTQDEETVARFRLRDQQAKRDDRRQMRQIQQWWLTRMIESPRPLEEKLTLFWHGHFATSYRTIEDSYHMYLQNQLFRSHAAGNFGELLFQIIRDPAMLAYLDNDESRRDRPNENLARELMELFSLGVGNYTEMDIKEGARALTGYTFRDDEFVFLENNHDSGSKKILGKRGALDGDDFVTAILETRACSRFICTKLYRFFVKSVPAEWKDIPRESREVITDLASTMLRSRYEIRPVLRRLFLSEHFYHDQVMNEQVKSPVELVVGAVRSLHTPVRDLNILLEAMDLMGQNIFFPPSVKGWDGGRSWINTATLFVRQNILAFLLTGKKPVGYDSMADKQVYESEKLLSWLAETDPSAARDPQRVVDFLLRLTLGTAPPTARATLEEFVHDHGGALGRDMITALLLIITAMPEYQLC